MKHFSLAIFLLTLLAFTGCGGGTPCSLSEFSIEKYAPRHASGYTIASSERGKSTLLTIRNPWQGALDVQQQVFLSRNDEPAPNGFEGQVVRTPVRRVVCMSSSHVAMFDAIGEIRRVAGVSGMEFISNPYINDHKFCGEIRDVGYDTNINFELLATIRPDVILLYGVTGENPAVTGKLSELGIPYIYIGDYVEESPLGKAEWLVAMAELCDRTEHGAEVFGGIRDRYNAQKELAAQQKPAQPVKVMLNTPYRDTWFMPSSRSYMVQLLQDAGAEYIYPKNDTGSSIPISIEEAYLLAREADLWINVGQLSTLGELKSQNPKFADMEVVNSRQVYNNNRRNTPAGGSDFWESGIVCPDKILADLIRIVHGNDTDLYYYQRLK